MSSKRVMTLGSLPLQPRASPRNDSWKRNKIQNRPKLTSTMFAISSTWCCTRSEMKTLGLYGGKSRDGGVRGALYSYCSRHAYRCPITPSLPLLEHERGNILRWAHKRQSYIFWACTGEVDNWTYHVMPLHSILEHSEDIMQIDVVPFRAIYVY